MTTPLPPEPDFEEWQPQNNAVVDATVIPHSREAEEATLGSIFIDPDCIADVFDVLQADDFYIHRHRWIYQAMLDKFLDAEPIDLLTISNALQAQGKLKEVGGFAYLTSLVNQVPTSINVLAYAHIVEGHAIRRKIINRANVSATLAYNQAKTIEEVVQEYDALNEDRPAPSKTTLINSTDAANQLGERIDAGLPAGIPTGLTVPDTEFGGFPKQAVTMLLGEASTGKTALLLQTCETLNYSGVRALYITLEEPAWRMVGRRVFTNVGISRVSFRSGTLTDAEKAMLKNEVANYTSTHKYLSFDQSARAVWQIRRSVHQSKAKLVIVDDLMHVHNEGKGKNGENEARQMIATVALLKDIAIDEDCAIVLIHHLDKDESERLFGKKKEVTPVPGQSQIKLKNKTPSLFNIPWANGLRYTIDMWICLVPDANTNLANDTVEMVLWLMKDKESARLQSEIHLWYDKVAQWIYDNTTKHLMNQRKPVVQAMPTVAPKPAVTPRPITIPEPEIPVEFSDEELSWLEHDTQEIDND